MQCTCYNKAAYQHCCQAKAAQVHNHVAWLPKTATVLQRNVNTRRVGVDGQHTHNAIAALLLTCSDSTSAEPCWLATKATVL